MSISIGLGTAIGGGLAALGGLSSAAVSAGATTKLNKKNRDWQEKMYSRKLADAREDYMRNVYYNSTQYKVKDMRAAGLNPNGSDAPVTGAVSQNSNPDVPSPVSQGYDTSGIAHGFASAGQILSQGIAASSQLDIQRDQVSLARMKTLSDIARNEVLNSVDSSIRSKNESEVRLNEIRERYEGRMFKAKIDNILSDTEMNLANSTNVRLKSIEQQIRNTRVGSLLDAEIGKTLAETQDLFSNIKLRIKLGNMYDSQTELNKDDHKMYYFKEFKLRMEANAAEFDQKLKRIAATRAEKDLANYVKDRTFNQILAVSEQVCKIADSASGFFMPKVNFQGYRPSTQKLQRPYKGYDDYNNTPIYFD